MEYVTTKQLNLNIPEMIKSCDRMYKFVLEHFPQNGSSWAYYATASTAVFDQYNMLLYPFNQFHELYEEIRTTFRELVNTKEPHYIQCWLNYYKKGEFIDWHGHRPPHMQSWHGYFCVRGEGSKTTYRLPTGEFVDVETKDNLLVLSKSDDDRHRTYPWEGDTPRITVAFDIVPVKYVPTKAINHWMPI